MPGSDHAGPSLQDSGGPAEGLMLAARDLRVLVMGLGDFTRGNQGIGARLAPSLLASLDDAEVRLASVFPGFADVLHDHDFVIVLKSLSY